MKVVVIIAVLAFVIVGLTYQGVGAYLRDKARRERGGGGGGGSAS
jgi:hypothetical protein